MSLITENRNKGFNYVQESSPVAYEDGLTWYKPSTKITYISNNNEWKDLWTAATCENDVAGTLWTWGNNYYGQLGLNDIVHRSSPVQVGNLANWKSVSSYYKSFILTKSDNTLWSCGWNYNGVLGLNDIIDRSSPVQVGNLTDWKYVSNGDFFNLAIKNDGTLWAWGYNKKGQLGQNDTINRSSPVQIGNLTDWSIVASSYGGTALSIKTDGTLWAWGYNSSGQLGLNDTIDRSSPVQIGNLATWSKIIYGYQFSMAIKTDGTLWAWGYNRYGELGLNDIIYRSSPVQVGTNTDWYMVYGCHEYERVGTIKTDGTLWTWGYNAFGQLGLNDIVHRSSPVQVGTDTNWSKISMGIQSMAIKTDGTLWSWGYNSNGELGLNDAVARSSPVQIGTGTNWADIECSQFACAKKYS